MTSVDVSAACNFIPTRDRFYSLVQIVYAYFLNFFNFFFQLKCLKDLFIYISITIVRRYCVSRPGDLARRVRAKWQRAHLDGNSQEALWNAMELRPGELQLVLLLAELALSSSKKNENETNYFTWMQFSFNFVSFLSGTFWILTFHFSFFSVWRCVFELLSVAFRKSTACYRRSCKSSPSHTLYFCHGKMFTVLLCC